MRKNIATIAALSLALLAQAASAQGQPRAITQIGTERLLAGQTVRLYVTGGDGGAAAENVRVEESADGVSFYERDVKSVSENANVDEGISFFFLLDNSGSMWTDLRGHESDDASALRIAHAKAAALDFLADVGPADKVGLAVFNTRYWRPLAPTADTRAVAEAVSEIAKPSKEDAFTELYLSLDRAIEEFAEAPGRRVLIVLSDGEDYPYLARTDRPSPDFGSAVSSPRAVIERAVSEGVTCYAVRFGADKDPSLGAVAVESGGMAFDADDQTELSGVYATIRADVLRETSVDYRAGMQPGDRRFVRASMDGGETWTPARYFYAGTVFGSARQRPGVLYLLPLLVAVALWLALWLFKLERPMDRAGISLLYGPSGKRTEIFALSGAKTVIGGGADADITIAGNPSLKASHATILFDEVRGEYTVAAPSDLTVNNRPVAKKRLESGDVINMAGTVVVFDDAESSMTSRTTNVRGAEGRAIPGARPRKQ